MNALALDAAAIDALRAEVRGGLIQPNDATYDEVRKVYNGMIDKRPALIVQCADVADVISAVNFARHHDLTLAVRGGGHNGPGLGICDDGLVIDLVHLRSIRVDPANSTVRVEGGCVWGDVDHATHPFGLAVPTGFLSSTGVGGLTLGGGIGYLSRKYGLTIDSLLGVDIVLADGRFVTASADENADLFWAVRGGGGNFGVVTSFLFQGRPVHTVYGGPMFWPLEMGAELLSFWQDFILDASDDMNGWFGFATVPPAPPFPEAYHLQKMCVIVWCYTGALETAEAAFAPIRQFSRPRSILPGRFLSPRCKACSMASIRLVCSGTGEQTSSTVTRMQRSTCTPNTRRNCPPCTRLCTSIRSTARRVACPRTRRLGAIETPTLRR
jgi:hypothetical protein